MTENYVAQQVAASGLPLYYWESKSTAELDFVFPVGANIYGVEAKKKSISVPGVWVYSGNRKNRPVRSGFP